MDDPCNVLISNDSRLCVIDADLASYRSCQSTWHQTPSHSPPKQQLGRESQVLRWTKSQMWNSFEELSCAHHPVNCEFPGDPDGLRNIMVHGGECAIRSANWATCRFSGTVLVISERCWATHTYKPSNAWGLVTSWTRCLDWIRWTPIVNFLNEPVNIDESGPIAILVATKSSAHVEVKREIRRTRHDCPRSYRREYGA